MERGDVPERVRFFRVPAPLALSYDAAVRLGSLHETKKERAQNPAPSLYIMFRHPNR